MLACWPSRGTDAREACPTANFGIPSSAMIEGLVTYQFIPSKAVFEYFNLPSDAEPPSQTRLE